MCIPLALLGNCSVKMLPLQRIHMQQWKICWTRRFPCDFYILTAVAVKSIVFWDITLCSPWANRHFAGTYRFHLQVWIVSQARNQHVTARKQSKLHAKTQDYTRQEGPCNPTILHRLVPFKKWMFLPIPFYFPARATLPPSSWKGYVAAKLRVTSTSLYDIISQKMHVFIVCLVFRVLNFL
jgi:hypothetical protein